MNFAYQYRYGDSIWNDYDSPSYRDHVFAYPTTNGVIDTIQWEGFREGVDDTRYAASLIKKEGSTTSARILVSEGLSRNENMTTLRKRVVDRILPSPVNRAPVLDPVANTSVAAGNLLTFTVRAADPDSNRLTFSAANLPANATFTPANRSFAWTPVLAQAGTYAVMFTVTDGLLNDTESAWITVSARAEQPAPVGSSPGPAGSLDS